MEVKDWVRAARKHKGWTLAQLGDAMGRSKATAGFWESGATKPSYKQMLQIAEETGYPLPNSEKHSLNGPNRVIASPGVKRQTGRMMAEYVLAGIADKDLETRKLVAAMLARFIEDPEKFASIPEAIDVLLAGQQQAHEDDGDGDDDPDDGPGGPKSQPATLDGDLDDPLNVRPSQKQLRPRRRRAR